MTARPRLGFTLIELLVVLAIMLLLGTLILAAAGLLTEKAEDLATRERLLQVERGLAGNAASGVSITERVQDELLGYELRWKPLAAVLNILVSEHGLDVSYREDYDDHLPPGLASLYDNGIGCFQPKHGRPNWHSMNTDGRDGLWQRYRNASMQVSDITLERAIIFMNFTDFTKGDQFYPLSAPGAAGGTPRWESAFGAGEARRHWWNKRRNDLAPVFVDNTLTTHAESDRTRYCWLYSRKSAIGEGLKKTLEIVPPSKVATGWYLEHWPILQEDRIGDTLVQRAWPDSDWNRAEPGTFGPVWEMPWGRKIITRVNGEQVDQFLRREADGEDRSIADLSPLVTVLLLRLAGTLPEDEAARHFATTRSREAPFNDRWGNPLVIGAGLFLAPRYYLDPQQLKPGDFVHDPTAEADNASHELNREFFSDLHGGRDWLLERTQEIYGAKRELYLSLGAVGPIRQEVGDDNPITSVIEDWRGQAPLQWDATDAVQHHQVLRALWLQVCAICGAEDYDDAAFADPPWEGINKVSEGPVTCFLGQPQTLH